MKCKYFTAWATRVDETVGPVALWIWSSVYSRAIRDLVYLRSRESLATICSFAVFAAADTLREPPAFGSRAAVKEKTKETTREERKSLAYQACRRSGRCQDRRDTSRRSDRDGTRIRSRLSRISAPWIPARSCRRTSRACSRKCHRARMAILEKRVKKNLVNGDSTCLCLITVNVVALKQEISNLTTFLYYTYDEELY